MITKLDGHKVLNYKQGPNTGPIQTMGATVNNKSTTTMTTESQPLVRTAAQASVCVWGGGGGAKCIVQVPNLRHRFCCCKNTKIVYLVWRLPNYCNVSSKRNNLIKLTHYDDTKKRAHDSQIVRSNVNLNLNHGGPSQRQASVTNQPIKALSQDHH